MRLTSQERHLAYKTLLLNYAQQFSFRSETETRRLAARFWKSLPHNLDGAKDQAEIVQRLDARLMAWASAIFQQELTPAHLSLMLRETSLSPLCLLLPLQDIPAEDLQRLKAQLKAPVPADHLTPMPVQSLAPFYK